MNNMKKSSPPDSAEVRKMAGMFQDQIQTPPSPSSDIVNTKEPVQTSEFAFSSILNEVKDKEVHGKHLK